MGKSCLDRKLSKYPVQIVAHRGFSGLYPENTLLSFKKAKQLGVDFMELDIRQTKDGELVVLHDERIDRTTEGKGSVKEMTFKEIRRYDAGKRKGFPGEKIPHLEEVFSLLDSGPGLLIEIKECDTEKLAWLLEKNKRTEKIFIGSFHLDYVRQIRKLLPVVPTSLISGALPENLHHLITLGIRKLDLEFHSLKAETVKKLVTSGFLVNAWTPDSRQDLSSTISCQVHFITTNRPDILKEILS